MIEFINLVKKYDHGVTAIDNVNLKIDKGEFAFLVGPSGSGKSTFLRLLIKEEEPTSGKIIVDGKDITRLKKKDIPFLRRKIGFVFQDFRLLYDRTVEENIVLALRVIEAPEKEIKAQLKSVLQMVGLVGKEKFFPNQLSGGEQQRVALARALATKPPIIIADEPTGNLDPITAEEIFKTLLEINSRGTTILVVTHAKDIVDSLNKRVIALDHGKVIKDEARGVY
ncbi:MAG: cell division ATP-binding protein FtsE [Clostridia bacterium]|jgi:cell division transport system ATP-binding protein|nr:cell division ATP-binding protein FtsE [Clostridia bacterium]